MLHHYPQIKNEEEILNMPIKKYRWLLNQCFNTIGLQIGAGFDYITPEEKESELRQEFNALKKLGYFNAG